MALAETGLNGDVQRHQPAVTGSHPWVVFCFPETATSSLLRPGAARTVNCDGTHYSISTAVLAQMKLFKVLGQQ